MKYYGAHRRKTEEDFWDDVDIGPPDECWLFKRPGRTVGIGYRSTKYDGKGWLFHRLSWHFTNGPIPDGMCVLHHCDNPPCGNPNHLFLGTQVDNMADMRSKGREHSQTGEGNSRAKLTEDVVLEIRRLYANGSKPRELMKQFNLPKSNTNNIIFRRTWKHL